MEADRPDLAVLFADYPKSVLARFKAFHAANPHVYRKFAELARQMASTGRPRYSARTIVEVMRWHFDLGTTGDPFEINGDFVPIYVRLFIYNNPQYLAFFELRRIRSRDRKSQEEREREGA